MLYVLSSGKGGRQYARCFTYQCVFFSAQLWNCGDVPFLTKSSLCSEKQQQNRSRNPKSFLSRVVLDETVIFFWFAYGRFQRDSFKIFNFFHDDDPVFASSLEKNEVQLFKLINAGFFPFCRLTQM